MQTRPVGIRQHGLKTTRAISLRVPDPRIGFVLMYAHTSRLRLVENTNARLAGTEQYKDTTVRDGDRSDPPQRIQGIIIYVPICLGFPLEINVIGLHSRCNMARICLFAAQTSLTNASSPFLDTPLLSLVGTGRKSTSACIKRGQKIHRPAKRALKRNIAPRTNLGHGTVLCVCSQHTSHCPS